MRQLVYEKGNTEFNPVKLRLKIDLVSYPARTEGLVNLYIDCHSILALCQTMPKFVNIYNGPCHLLTANNVIKTYCLSSVQYLPICICKHFPPRVYAKREHDPTHPLPLSRRSAQHKHANPSPPRDADWIFAKSILGLGDLYQHLINSFDERQISFLVFCWRVKGGSGGCSWCWWRWRRQRQNFCLASVIL